MNYYLPRNVLIGQLVFLSIGALFGGGTLIISPSGDAFDMPLHLLKHTPFPNFFIPGLLLFGFMGVLPLPIIYGLLIKPNNDIAENLNLFPDMHWSWTCVIVQAFILIIWIQTEMQLIQMVHWLHGVYTLLGITILFNALLPSMRNHYKKIKTAVTFS